jgi:hypothetical protein
MKSKFQCVATASIASSVLIVVNTKVKLESGWSSTGKKHTRVTQSKIFQSTQDRVYRYTWWNEGQPQQREKEH